MHVLSHSQLSCSLLADKQLVPSHHLDCTAGRQARRQQVVVIKQYSPIGLLADIDECNDDNEINKNKKIILNINSVPIIITESKRHLQVVDGQALMSSMLGGK